MATVPKKKTWIEFYEALVAREATSLTMEDPIWAQGPSVSQAEKEAFIEESNKKIELEEVRSKFLKSLQALKLSMEEADIKRHTEEYVKLLPLARLSYVREQNGDVEEQATKLILAFGTANKAIQYLKKFENKNPDVKPLVHDACLFTLPHGKWDVKLWQELVSRHMLEDKFKAVFGRAAKVQAYVEMEKKQFIENITNKIYRKWERKFGDEYEETPRTEEEYLKKNKEKIERQINYEFGLIIKDKKLSGERLKEYRLSEEGRSAYDKIKENTIEQFKLTFKAPSNLEKQKYIEDRLSGNSKIIKQEIEREIGLILSPETSLEALVAYSDNIKYERSAENPKASRIFSENGMTEEAFNLYLSVVPKDSNRIPPLMKEEIPVPLLVKGSEMGYSDKYYLTKLSPLDPRCAVLGKLTSCCQHFDNVGKDCARHGIESEEGGVYILCERTGDVPSLDDPIVSQCWAWRSQSGALVFDSVETITHYRDKYEMMISDFFTLWADKLVTQHNISRVLVGESVTPDMLGSFPSLVNEFPIDYDGYRDSNRQRIVADKFLPFVGLYKNLQSKEGSKLTELKELKELKETEERKRTKEEEVAEKSLILEWCALCASSSMKLGLSYVMNHAKAIGLSEEQVNLWYEELKQFLALLNNPEKYGKSLEKCLELAKKGIPVFSIRDKNGKTILMKAVQKGKIEVISTLLKAGADKYLEVQTKDRRTALMLAAEKGNESVISVLLEAGAGRLIHVKDQYARTTLMWAVISGKLAAISVLLKAGANKSINEKDNNLQTALMLAVLSGADPGIISSLLEAGAAESIHMKDKEGKTVLMMAAKNANAEIISILLKYGAGKSIHEKDNQGQTALMIAAKYNSSEEVSSILAKVGGDKLIFEKTESEKSALMMAVEEGNANAVSALLKAGADKTIHEKNKYGYTLLMVAIRESRIGNRQQKMLEIISILLKGGADKSIHEKDTLDETTLMIAARHGTAEMVSALLKAGADKSMFEKNFNQETALMAAARDGVADNISVLLQAGMKTCIDARNLQGETALTLAIGSGKVKAVSALIDGGADIFSKYLDNNTGVERTPFMLAVERGPVAVVEALLKAGGSRLLEEKDRFGRTPLSLAESKKQTEIVKFLKTELEKLEKEKFEKESKETKASAEVAEPTAPPVIFTLPVSSQAAPEEDILKEAAEFREPSKRMGPAFEQFKAKLGLTASDIVEEIGEQQIKVKAMDGSTQSFDIENRYKEQLAKAPSSRPSSS